MANTDVFRRVFAAAGMPRHIADGFIANFIFESGGGNDIDTGNRTGDGGRSWGAAHWLGDRRAALLNFAAQRGTEWTDPETQAEFVLHELRTTERNALARIVGAPDAASATRAIMEHYERPGIPHLDQRLQLAAQVAGTGPQDRGMMVAPRPTTGQPALRTVSPPADYNARPAMAYVGPGATPRQPAAPSATPNAGSYTIARGDTLGALAQRFGTTVDELVALNGIANRNRIYEGGTLRLPGSAAAAQPEAAAPGGAPLPRPRPDPAGAGDRLATFQALRGKGLNFMEAARTAFAGSGVETAPDMTGGGKSIPLPRPRPEPAALDGEIIPPQMRLPGDRSPRPGGPAFDAGDPILAGAPTLQNPAVPLGVEAETGVDRRFVSSNPDAYAGRQGALYAANPPERAPFAPGADGWADPGAGAMQVEAAFAEAERQRTAAEIAYRNADRYPPEIQATNRRIGTDMRIAPPAEPVERSIGEGEYLPAEERLLMQLASLMRNAPKANTTVPQLGIVGRLKRPLAAPTTDLLAGAPMLRRMV